MASTQSNLSHLAERGEELYERSIRERVEPQFRGQYLAIDLDSGDYEVDSSSNLAARDRLCARHPCAQVYFKRIGHSAVVRFRSPRREQLS